MRKSLWNPPVQFDECFRFRTPFDASSSMGTMGTGSCCHITIDVAVSPHPNFQMEPHRAVLVLFPHLRSYSHLEGPYQLVFELYDDHKPSITHQDRDTLHLSPERDTTHAWYRLMLIFCSVPHQQGPDGRFPPSRPLQFESHALPPSRP